VREHLQFDLKEQMLKDGIDTEQFNVRVNITPVTTIALEVIWVEYRPATETIAYIPPVVKIEVSGRSMAEPIAEVAIESLIDKAVPQAKFHEPKFNVRAVLAKRTFLEKIFLLHEEFAKDAGQIRVDRMSRHLYDVNRIMQTPIAEEALSDNDLYNTVIEHRRTFIGLKGFGYNTLAKPTLKIIPPESVYAAWKKDYETMQQEMIYVESVPFDQIISDLKMLNDKINNSFR